MPAVCSFALKTFSPNPALSPVRSKPTVRATRRVADRPLRDTNANYGRRGLMPCLLIIEPDTLPLRGAAKLLEGCSRTGHFRAGPGPGPSHRRRRPRLTTPPLRALTRDRLRRMPFSAERRGLDTAGRQGAPPPRERARLTRK